MFQAGANPRKATFFSVVTRTDHPLLWGEDRTPFTRGRGGPFSPTFTRHWLGYTIESTTERPVKHSHLSFNHTRTTRHVGTQLPREPLTP